MDRIVIKGVGQRLACDFYRERPEEGRRLTVVLEDNVEPWGMEATQACAVKSAPAKLQGRDGNTFSNVGRKFRSVGADFRGSSISSGGRKRCSHNSDLAPQAAALFLYGFNCSESKENASRSDCNEAPCTNDVSAVPPVLSYRHGGKFADNYGMLLIYLGMVGGSLLAAYGWVFRLLDGCRLSGWIIVVVGMPLRLADSNSWWGTGRLPGTGYAA